jgi:hypothetical protein
MANLTLSLDEKLLQAARLRATKEGTSVNEICRKAIENYARADSGGRLQRFESLIAQLDAETGSKPLRSPWKSRDEMYEELIAPSSKR